MLEPAVHALVRFGLALDKTPVEGNLHRAEWDAVALKALYRPDRDAGLRGRYRLVLDGVSFCIDKTPTGLSVTLGECVDPVAGIALDKATGRDIAAKRITVREAEASGRLERQGDRRQSRALMAAFGVVD